MKYVQSHSSAFVHVTELLEYEIKLFENLPVSFDLIYNERKESAFGLKSLKLNIQLHCTGHYIWINQIHKEVFQLIEHALVITSHVSRLMCITILINPSVY